MELAELMPSEKWIELEIGINRISGLNAAVYDVHGKRITEYKKWANRLCPAIRQTEKGLKFICSVAHQNIASQAIKTGKTIIDECDAGMMKFVVPIFIEDEFLGVAGGCGKLYNSGQVDTYLVHRTAGLDEKAVIGLSGSVKSIPIDNLSLVVGYLEKKLNEIIESFRSELPARFEQAV